MPANYVEVLADLDAQIFYHETELETLKAARPAILKLSGTFSPLAVPESNAAPIFGKFTGLGTTAAVRELMKDGELRNREQIFRALSIEGWKSDATSPIGSLGATLSQMREELERVEDRWRKKTLAERVVGSPIFGPPAIPPAPLPVPVPLPAPSSASLPPSRQ